MFILLLLVFVTAAAEDTVSSRGCRRGTLRPHNQLLRRSTAQTRQPGGDFYKSDLHQLTVLVEFNDRAFKGDEAATLEQWNKIFNTENFTEGSFKGSIRDYFCAQSYNQFRPVFDLVYVKVSGNTEKYASTQKDDENSQYLVQDIMDVLKLNTDIKWSLYDWNGDGYVNQLLIVFAGKGSSYGGFGGGTEAIWPHQLWMSEHLKDRKQGEYCDPIPVTYGGKEYLVNCYCAVQELASNDSYGAFGTLCHEYSHCFGFPDFYSNQKLVDKWDLMDYGNYNGGGFHPCGYSAHERWLMDWLTPEELTATTTITDLPPLADEGRAYLLRNDGYDQEYYIVEHRQQSGWDQSLPGYGIVIFHIDYDPELWTSLDEPANGGSVNHYVLFHAGNTSRQSDWAYPCEANDSLTNTSKPAATLNHANIDGSMFMSKPITRMALTDGLASFDVFIDTPSSLLHLPSDFSHQSSVLYRLGPVTIVRDDKGRVHKVITP